MSGRQQLYVLLLHAAVGIGVLLGATVLAALHDLDPQATVAIYGAAIGLAGGSASALASLGSTVNGKSLMTQQTLDNMTENMRHAVSELAGARTQVDAANVAEAAATMPPPPPPTPV